MPTVCAYSFSVCRIQISQVCYSYVRLGPKLHICILFPVYVHYIFMNATSYSRYYLFSVQVNQYIFTYYQLFSFHYQYQFSKFSIFISIDSSSIQYSFLSLYLLSFVAHLVLFTIPGSSRGVPVVGPSSCVQ